MAGSPAFRALVVKLGKQKVRSPGGWLTCQEIFTLLLYGLGMGWSIWYLKNPIDVGMSLSPTPEPMPSFGDGFMGSRGGGSPVTSGALLFAPETATSRAAVQGAANLLAKDNLVVGYATHEALLTAYADSASIRAATLAGIFFEGGDADASGIANYTIALNRDNVAWSDEDKYQFSWDSQMKERVVYEVRPLLRTPPPGNKKKGVLC